MFFKASALRKGESGGSLSEVSKPEVNVKVVLGMDSFVLQNKIGLKMDLF